VTQPIGDAGAAPQPRTPLDIGPVSALRLLVVALAGAAVFAVVDSAPSILTKIGVGIVLALALDPVVVRAKQRFRWQRGTAVALVGGVLGLVFLGVLAILGPAAIEQAGSLREDLPATIEDAYSWPVIGDRLARNDVATQVDDAIEKLPARLDDATITRYAEDLLGGLLTAIVVLVTAIGVMLDGARLVERFRGLFGPAQVGRMDAIGRVIYRTFGNYFAGSLFVAILNGLVVLTLAIVLGIPLAPLAGLWSTLTNLIPQIGGFLGGGFLVILALTQGPVTAAIAIGVFMVYQNFENNVIQPAVIGKAVNLTPPTTMLAALIGGSVAGVPGALIATPIVGAAKVLYLRDMSDGAVDLEGITEPTPDERADDEEPEP
jgi:predicted PurR-regulated permease PerM